MTKTHISRHWQLAAPAALLAAGVDVCANAQAGQRQSQQLQAS
jgi:hypothetical protein